jgi:hypothetical protein
MDEPGGPLQRGFALHWLGVIAEELKIGKPVLLDAQLRIAFIHEALTLHGIKNARIILLECLDESREIRLHGRGHPELVNEDMRNWVASCIARLRSLGTKFLIQQTSP